MGITASKIIIIEIWVAMLLVSRANVYKVVPIYANITKIPALKNWAIVILTINVVWNSVRVSARYFFVVIYKVIKIIELKIVTITELEIYRKNLVVESLADKASNWRPYWAPPPRIKITIAIRPYSNFLQIDPVIVIPLFSHNI